MWNVWWIWLVASLLLSSIELLLPGYIFLGFAIGSGVTGILLGIGGPIGDWMQESLPVTVLVFAVVSLVSWFVMRRVLGVREGQVKHWDRDINDD